MACPDINPPPTFPPPPPPHPPFPPPGGDACNQVVYECTCGGGTPVWTLVSSVCVPNADCSGIVNCNPTWYTAEIINGCAAGVPLAAFTPADSIPPCTPDCCNTKKCKFLWTIYCKNGSWSVPSISHHCEDCTISAWAATDGLGCVQQKTDCGESCTSETSCVDPGAPVPPVPPGGIPNCCKTDPDAVLKCAFRWNAVCTGGSWSMTPGTPYGNCVTCEADGSWQFTDACHATQLFCAGPCAVDGDCGSLGAPLVPGSPPFCCVSEFCNCVYSSTWNCGSSTWGTPTLVGSCTTDFLDKSAPWQYTSGCDAQTTVSATGSCT